MHYPISSARVHARIRAGRPPATIAINSFERSRIVALWGDFTLSMASHPARVIDKESGKVVWETNRRGRHRPTARRSLGERRRLIEFVAADDAIAW
jgi:hypothetical protein